MVRLFEFATYPHFCKALIRLNVTYSPNSMKSNTHTRVATITSSVRPTLCHILTLLPFQQTCTSYRTAYLCSSLPI